MSDEQDVATQLENMMSHGIFDSEAVANTFRVKGWKFVIDPEQGTSSGGAYVVRSPGGRTGLVNWYNKETINSLTENAAFFLDDQAPPHMFLAWIFADQMGRLILNRAFDDNPDGSSNPPGPTFENAYVAFKQAATQIPRPVPVDVVEQVATAENQAETGEVTSTTEVG